MKKEIKRLLKEYIYPGQVWETKNISVSENWFVENNVPWTYIGWWGKIRLWMPKWFNKCSYNREVANSNVEVSIFWSVADTWWCDQKNVPVWYKQEGTDLFVKIFSPRINRISVWIIANTNIEEFEKINTSWICPIDVWEFYDEID